MGTPNKNAVWVDEVTVETVNFILGTNAVHLVHQTPEVQLQVIKGTIGLMKIVAVQNVSSCTVRKYLHERNIACGRKLKNELHGIDQDARMLMVFRPEINGHYNSDMTYRGFALLEDGILLVIHEMMKSSSREKFVILTEKIVIFKAEDCHILSFIINRNLTSEFLHLLVQVYQGEISRVRNMEKVLIDGMYSVEDVCLRAWVPPFRNLSLIGGE